MEDELENRRVEAAIDAFLWSLGEEKRAVFVRRYWYGEPAGKHVKRLWRLRQKLKAYLEQEGVPL